MKKRLYNYMRIIEAFGLFYGFKVIIMRWISHFTDKKLMYKIQTRKGAIWLRINSSDVELARVLMRKKGGEYDFINDIAEIDSFKCIIDAGANIGLFSVLARRAARNAKIIAIEPDSDNCRAYNKNMELRENDVFLQAGLWNKCCKLSIRERKTGDMGYVVYEDENGIIDAISMKKIIELYQIDSIDLLKIDIEGSEYEVFDETVDEWIELVKVLIIETHDRIKPGCEKRVYSVMEKHGYSHRKIGENDIFERDACI